MTVFTWSDDGWPKKNVFLLLTSSQSKKDVLNFSRFISAATTALTVIEPSFAELSFLHWIPSVREFCIIFSTASASPCASFLLGGLLFSANILSLLFCPCFLCNVMWLCVSHVTYKCKKGVFPLQFSKWRRFRVAEFGVKTSLPHMGFCQVYFCNFKLA